MPRYKKRYVLGVGEPDINGGYQAGVGYRNVSGKFIWLELNFPIALVGQCPRYRLVLEKVTKRRGR